jgi:hypothetical protein
MAPCSVQPLGPGERRFLGVVSRADGNTNQFFLARAAPDADPMIKVPGDPIFVVTIVYSDPGEPPMDWITGPTEEAVVIRLAEGWANSPPPAGALRTTEEVACYLNHLR